MAEQVDNSEDASASGSIGFTEQEAQRAQDALTHRPRISIRLRIAAGFLVTFVFTCGITIAAMVFIVLPQALRAVLPAIVGQFIALFKDTTLVVIVGINDLLGIGRSIINSDPEFVQHQMEVYLFIALIYWIFSYLMSQASSRLETALGVSTRL